MPRRPPNVHRTLYGMDVFIPKGVRIRGHELAELLEHGATFGVASVSRSRVRQEYIPPDVKARLGIPFNIYDAARSYKETHKDPRGLRAIIKDEEFRTAWYTFRGGHHWERKESTGWALERRRKIPHGITSTTEEKLNAASVIGWTNKTEAIDALRRASP